MKKMILVAMVFMMAQVSMAVGLSKETAATRVKSYTESIDKAKLDIKNGGDFRNNATLKEKVNSSILKIVTDSQAGEVTNLMKLINTETSALVEVARLHSIIQDKAASAAEIKQAKEGLDLLSLAARNIDALAKNDAEAKANQEQAQLAIDISFNISKFADYSSKTANTFAAEYKKALESNNPRKAIEIANRKTGKQLTEEQLKTCTP